nr:lysozyme C-like [Procambarus clarkii]
MRVLAWWRVLAVVAVLAGTCSGKVFTKCGLASLLEKTYGLNRDVVKRFVCIAQYESGFNTKALNVNSNGSKDYGIFQLNNQYWCLDSRGGKNVCKMACSNLLNDNLSDDVRCARTIVRETESWKGKGTGFTAWAAYVTHCQNRNLDVYMSECWRSG